jgi:hypothetical protein
MAEDRDPRGPEQSPAQLQDLLDDIRRLLENNAVEVWQTYRQIRIEAQ